MGAVFPMFFKNVWGTGIAPQFLKSVWETGTVPQVPQNVNYLENIGTVFPKKFGEHISLSFNEH